MRQPSAGAFRISAVSRPHHDDVETRETELSANFSRAIAVLPTRLHRSKIMPRAMFHVNILMR